MNATNMHTQEPNKPLSSANWTQRFRLGDGSITVGVKDCIAVAGYATACGSEACDATPAAEHAEVVARLLTGDYTLTGKTNLHELAFGMTGVNTHTGTPINPRYPLLITGGSSSGSAAAVAAGEVDIALGTDTGGSVRLPAACCGIYGFKPTYGRVSRQGLKPEHSSLDCVGLFARSLPLLSHAQATLDPDFGQTPFAAQPALEDLRIGVYLDGSVDWMAQQIQSTLAGFNLNTQPASLPSFDAAYQAGMTLISQETAQANAAIIHHPRLGADVQARLMAGSQITSQQAAQAEAVRRQFKGELAELFERVDVLITPALVDVPLTRQAAMAGQQDLNLSRFLRPFNLSGNPALVIPIHYAGPQPVALQLVANHHRDAWLCALGQHLITTYSSILGANHVLA
ncbi:amidase [Halioxenophilus aromaticivorans]